jgi:preprotein translocase subunit SecY
MKHKIAKKVISKLLYTLLIVVLLTIANNTIYPGIKYSMYAFSKFNKHILDLCSITSQGIRPNIIASIMINLITSVSQYFNLMQKRSETKSIYEKIYITLIVIISIIYSLM